MLIIVIIYDMALFLPDDIKCTQHIQCIIYSSLHIFEINSLLGIRIKSKVMVPHRIPCTILRSHWQFGYLWSLACSSLSQEQFCLRTPISYLSSIL